ncbi:HAUS augmin-like complex subunit 1 isoform X2 [Lingula anatina]|uniref:HAUS augmin-like complex subunit 1 isoform X1 n=1 Tax=Lingula anatina TaxID=7574 RepID=A0A1S3HV62_LINAN|nr:HAUS augmin-like complex subunit 1 isoform X1 [Lingula anatina]XP_013389908.1 HAUS augmin-like complex subunit 1 isoform X2 [Lingula anatina]|eukprot:XP_013389907.1 HAUS augmin-like complex subunit 1 isoform X1 [Lingula anatina]
MTLNDKHRQVRVWLEKLYAGDPIPQYEISQRPVEILYELMLKNEQNDRCAQLLIEDDRQKAEEYNLEAVRLAGILQEIGLTTSSLSKSGLVSLRTLTSVAQLLEIKDACDTSFLLGISEISQAQMKISEARNAEQKQTGQLISQTNSALHKTAALKKTIHNLKEQAKYQGPDLEKKAKQAGFLQSKAREYKGHIQKYQTTLSQSGMEPHLYHQALGKKAEELQQLKAKLGPLRLKLDGYHRLPPNISMAKVKIEEVKRDLAVLEAELAKRIDSMHML